MDETCKRFLIKGRSDLEALDSRLNVLTDALVAKDTTARLPDLAKAQIKNRYTAFVRLSKEATSLSKMMDIEHQATKRLKDAIALRQRLSDDDEAISISDQLERLRISTPTPDNQITLGARLISIKAGGFVLNDKFRLLNSNTKIEKPILDIRLNRLTILFLEDCQNLIIQAKGGSLSRIVITATLVFAKVSELFGWYHRTHPPPTNGKTDQKGQSTALESRDNRRNTAREFLADALHLCDELGNCEALREKVEEMNRLYGDPRYEEVTPEELASIKIAMVDGRGGMATNSGHWYNCINGHPVSRICGIFEVFLARYKANILCLSSSVCHWRMWYADGASEMP